MGCDKGRVEVSGRTLSTRCLYAQMVLKVKGTIIGRYVQEFE